MFLDANFFIYLNFGMDEKAGKAMKIVQEIMAGKGAITSSLVLDEVMWVIKKQGFLRSLRPVIEDIYAIPHLKVVDVPSSTPLRALHYLEQHNLDPRDALHCATMEHFGETEIVSADKDFDKVKSIKRIKI